MENDQQTNFHIYGYTTNSHTHIHTHTHKPYLKVFYLSKKKMKKKMEMTFPFSFKWKTFVPRQKRIFRELSFDGILATFTNCFLNVYQNKKRCMKVVHDFMSCHVCSADIPLWGKVSLSASSGKSEFNFYLFGKLFLSYQISTTDILFWLALILGAFLETT